MHILARTISQGRIAGMISVLGVATGVLVHTLLAAIGLSAVLATSALVFTFVKCVGAAYLIYLGIRALLGSNRLASTPRVAASNVKEIFWQGFLTNVLNPKVAIFFLAFLPQFVAPESSSSTSALAFLGSLFVSGGTLWCLLLVAFASRFSKTIRTDERLMELVGKAVGVVYVGLGLNLLRAKL